MCGGGHSPGVGGCVILEFGSKSSQIIIKFQRLEIVNFLLKITLPLGATMVVSFF